MPPRATGTVQWVGDPESPSADDHWKARLRVPDAREPRKVHRPWVHLPPGLSRAEAEARASRLQERANATQLVTPSAPTAALPSPAEVETVKEWCTRWLVWRRSRKLTSVRNDESRLRTWLWPSLGTVPMAAVTRRDLEVFVADLDAKVREGRASWKTAWNIWAVVRKAFSDATSAKDPRMRVRSENPTLGVEGPDRGVRKAKVYLYPSEFLALVRCERVPLAWRRTFAMAVYVYARAGELAALEWSAVDLTNGVIHIHQALDYDTGQVKSTKGKETRRFALEPNVVPVFEAVRAEQPNAVRVFDAFTEPKDLAVRLRHYLEVAGVTRAELFTTDETRKNITFHDLRATGITWAAIRGDGLERIQYRAGHATASTTQGYIREAEAVGAAVGEVFPELPLSVRSLFGPGPGATRAIALETKGIELCEEGDLNPKSGLSHDTPALESAENQGIERAESCATVRDRADAGTELGPIAPVSPPSPARAPDPRSEGLATLTRSMGELLAAGDLEGARILYRALGELLAVAPVDAPATPLTSTTGRLR